MRPASIVAFERLSLLALAIGLLVSVLTWDDNAGTLVAQGLSETTLIVIQAVTFLLLVGLVLGVSRGRSNVAKWIYVVLFVVGLVYVVPQLGSIFSRGLLGLVQALQLLLQVAALVLLFKRESSEWLARKTAP